MADFAAVLAATDRPDYAAGVGFVRAREKRTRLTPLRLAEILSLDAPGVLARMKSHDAGRLSSPAGGAGDPDLVLAAEVEAEYRAVARFDPEGLVVPMLRWRHDLYNLRAALTSRRDGLPVRWSGISGNQTPAAIEAWAATGRGIDWPPLLEAVALEARAKAGVGMAERFDLAWVDFGLDRCRANDLPLLEAYFVALGDGALVRQAWRRICTGGPDGSGKGDVPSWSRLPREIARASDRRGLAALLEGSHYGPGLREGLDAWRSGGPWAALETELEALLIDRLRPSAFISLGPEPLAAFLLMREIDLETIRLVHLLKASGWPEDRIRRFARRARHA